MNPKSLNPLRNLSKDQNQKGEAQREPDAAPRGARAKRQPRPTIKLGFLERFCFFRRLVQGSGFRGLFSIRQHGNPARGRHICTLSELGFGV